MKYGALLLLAPSLLVFGCAHSTYHELASPPSLPSPDRACTVGIARFADDAGVDFAPELRDYLGQHGPCRTVLMVTDPGDDRADAVVSGSVKYGSDDMGTVLRPGDTPQGAAWPLVFGESFVAITPGAALTIGGAASNDSTVTAIGAGILGVGLFVASIGIFDAVDNGGRRELAAKLTADVDITRKQGGVDHVTFNDDLAVRMKPTQQVPTGDPSLRVASFQPALLERVFEHVASRLGDDLAAR